jgi:hypothetical protein
MNCLKLLLASPKFPMVITLYSSFLLFFFFYYVQIFVQCDVSYTNSLIDQVLIQSQ